MYSSTFQMGVSGESTVSSPPNSLATASLPLEIIASSTPISPPSGPATGSSNGLHRESNFLAVGLGLSLLLRYGIFCLQCGGGG